MRKLLLVLVMVLLAGCTVARQTAINISNEEVENATAVRVVARNYLSIWDIQGGFIRAALGSRIDELPAEAVKAMDELDELAKVTDPNSYTDGQLGASLGLRIRLLSAVVAKALDVYAPDVLQAIPLLL